MIAWLLPLLATLFAFAVAWVVCERLAKRSRREPSMAPAQEAEQGDEIPGGC